MDSCTNATLGGILRATLLVEHTIRNWRTMPYDAVCRFLHFLFSDNPKKNGYGIFIAFEGDKWYISFKGCFDFPLGLITNEDTAREFQMEMNRINAEAKAIFDEGAAKAKREYEMACKEMGLCDDELKPNKSNLGKYC